MPSKIGTNSGGSGAVFSPKRPSRRRGGAGKKPVLGAHKFRTQIISFYRVSLMGGKGWIFACSDELDRVATGWLCLFFYTLCGFFGLYLYQKIQEIPKKKDKASPWRREGERRSSHDAGSVFSVKRPPRITRCDLLRLTARSPAFERCLACGATTEIFFFRVLRVYLQ